MPFMREHALAPQETNVFIIEGPGLTVICASAPMMEPRAPAIPMRNVGDEVGSPTGVAPGHFFFGSFSLFRAILYTTT